MMNLTQKLIQLATSLYKPEYLGGLVRLLQNVAYNPVRYLGRYWTTQDFSSLADQRPTMTRRNRALLYFVFLGSLLQAMLGLTVLIFGWEHHIDGSLPIGVALILAYPIVWAQMLAVAQTVYIIVWSLMHLKAAGKHTVCTILNWQVRRLRARHDFFVIAVAGSIGKTSTKLAIAHALEPTRRVIYQTGNYNDPVTVPLVLFGQKLPNLFNLLAWLRIFFRNERTIKRQFFYDVAVLELGTDAPGTMTRFAYLQPDLTVITAITPEHMEYFGTLDAVAAEELTVCDYSKQVLINADDIQPKHIHGKHLLRYSAVTTSGVETADFRASKYVAAGLQGGTVELTLQEAKPFKAQATILGQQGVKILLAAAAAAKLSGLKPAEICQGLAEVKPFAGRMQVLAGIQNATIIDDSYNASPAAVIAGLDVLYAADASQRIAILGNMNELGAYSPAAHREVGDYCDGRKLDLIVTIGHDAKKYLAPAASVRGCKVVTAESPYQAGDVVKNHLQAGAVVLVEGSQNKVFAEESIKTLLAHKADSRKLVRQSADWLAIKRKQFADTPKRH